MKRHCCSPHGFSLIEILVVVSIIMILASIGLYNFIDAQTRSKVSRAIADKRSIATALEAYRVDNSNYPMSLPQPLGTELVPLTTPIAYITTIPHDIFDPHDAIGQRSPSPHYDYVRYAFLDLDVRHIYFGYPEDRAATSPYFVASVGPDTQQECFYMCELIPEFSFIDASYDPTNGTISRGDIFRHGGGGRME